MTWWPLLVVGAGVGPATLLGVALAIGGLDQWWGRRKRRRSEAPLFQRRHEA